MIMEQLNDIFTYLEKAGMTSMLRSEVQGISGLGKMDKIYIDLSSIHRPVSLMLRCHRAGLTSPSVNTLSRSVARAREQDRSAVCRMPTS